MNYFDLPEYASLAPFVPESGVAPGQVEESSSVSLKRLAARIHRQAVAPRGYRFVENILGSDLERAQSAIAGVSVAGELKLVRSAVDDAGSPVSDVALYIRNHLPDPAEFRAKFNAGGGFRAA